MTTEFAMTHGYLSARVKGHADKRNQEWRRVFGQSAKDTGQPNEAGWKKLAALFGKGGGEVIVGGERLVVN